MENKKISRRDALKRIGKMAVAASVASVAPVNVLAVERREHGPIGYNSFGYKSYGSYQKHRSYGSYQKYGSYQSYYSCKK